MKGTVLRQLSISYFKTQVPHTFRLFCARHTYVRTDELDEFQTRTAVSRCMLCSLTFTATRGTIDIQIFELIITCHHYGALY